MPSFRTGDGVRLAFEDAGDGPVVVLINGYCAPATAWILTTDALLAAGYRVIGFDRRSHGESETPMWGQRMARHGRDLGELLDHLGVARAALVGASMGGNVIWAYIDQYGTGRLSGVAIVDQTPKMLNTPDWPHGFYGYTASNIDSYFAERIPETGHGTPMARKGVRLVRLLLAMKGMDREMTRGELALLNDHAKADWRDAIRATEVPVLFVAGDESEYWPASHAAASAALAPRGASVVLEKDGHPANMEQPKAFNAAMLGWLAGV